MHNLKTTSPIVGRIGNVTVHKSGNGFLLVDWSNHKHKYIR